jgi:hypothetical protein
MAIDFVKASNESYKWTPTSGDYDAGSNWTALTVAAWVKMKADPPSTGSHDIVSKWLYSTDKGWTMFWSNSNQKWAFEVAYDDTSSTDLIDVVDTITNTAWFLIVGRWTTSLISLDLYQGSINDSNSSSISHSTISDTANTTERASFLSNAQAS